jgi:hypothetical protein
LEINTPADISILTNYTSISGYLAINCPTCTDLSALYCLNAVGGGLAFKNNSSLTDLFGLENLTDITETLGFFDNNAFSDLTVLNGLTYVGGLKVYDNTLITDFTGLNNIVTIGPFGLYVVDSPAFTTFNGLNSVLWIEGSLKVAFASSTCALTSFAGLDSLLSVGMSLEIHFTEHVTHLNNLGNLTSIGSGSWLRVHNNEDLSYCAICDLWCHITSGPGATSVSENEPSGGCWDPGPILNCSTICP